MNPTDNGAFRIKLSKTDDGGKQQTLQTTGRHKETIGGAKHGAPRLQNYGFSAHAPSGSMGWSAHPNGSPELAVITGIEHPDHRPTGLAEGEWKMYTRWGDPKHNLHAQEKKWTLTIGDQKITVDEENKKIIVATKDTTITLDNNAKTITLKADTIILDGTCKLGGSGSDTFVPASKQGTVDTAGDSDTSNFATKVNVR